MMRLHTVSSRSPPCGFDVGKYQGVFTQWRSLISSYYGRTSPFTFTEQANRSRLPHLEKFINENASLPQRSHPQALDQRTSVVASVARSQHYPQVLPHS